MQLPQLAQRARRLTAQVQQLHRVLAQHLAGIGQRAVARRPLQQHLAQLRLQLGDRLAHRRLGSVQPRRRPREAALLRHRQKRLQLKQVHPYHLKVFQ